MEIRPFRGADASVASVREALVSVRVEFGGRSVRSREREVSMQVRIAIAIESNQGRWIAYGASDTPECELMSTVREIIAGHPVTMWLEVQLPEPPATVPARLELHDRKYDC
jgi:hypothetical protein